MPRGLEGQLTAFADVAGIAIAGERNRDRLRALAEEQAALRRVAELVARGAPTGAVFSALTDESSVLLGGMATALLLYEGEETVVVATCRSRARALGINAVLAAHRLDALVAPTGGPAWTTDLINGDHFAGASSTPGAVAGYPSVTVPAGEVRGLPVGLWFNGTAWSEPRLLALAYAYEQATKHRRPPAFLAKPPM